LLAPIESPCEHRPIGTHRANRTECAYGCAQARFGIRWNRVHEWQRTWLRGQSIRFVSKRVERSCAYQFWAFGRRRPRNRKNEHEHDTKHCKPLARYGARGALACGLLCPSESVPHTATGRFRMCLTRRAGLRLLLCSEETSLALFAPTTTLIARQGR